MPSMEITTVYLTPKTLRGSNVSLDRKSELMSAAAVAVNTLLEYYKEHMDNRELLDNMERERNLLKEEQIENLTAEEIDSRVYTLGIYVVKLFLAGEARNIGKFRKDQQDLKGQEKERQERKYDEHNAAATVSAKRRNRTPDQKSVTRLISLYEEAGEPFDIFKLQAMAPAELRKLEKEIYDKL